MVSMTTEEAIEYNLLPYDKKLRYLFTNDTGMNRIRYFNSTRYYEQFIELEYRFLAEEEEASAFEGSAVVNEDIRNKRLRDIAKTEIEIRLKNNLNSRTDDSDETYEFEDDETIQFEEQEEGGVVAGVVEAELVEVVVEVQAEEVIEAEEVDEEGDLTQREWEEYLVLVNMSDEERAEATWQNVLQNHRDHAEWVKEYILN